VVLRDGDVGEGVEEGRIETAEVDYLFCYNVSDFLWVFGGEAGSKVS
jgi:hypothetical protein